MASFKHKVSHIHFVGIGGVGMSGIAEVLFNLGYKVTGSDLGQNATTKHLESIGIKVSNTHNTDNVGNADVVVVSSAIKANNPEVSAAHELRIPVIKRAVMLAELMRFKQSIAIAGTHGKTTTTSLIASIFAFAKLDPTYVIGGKLLSLGTNAALGSGEYFIAEADESDGSFLYLNPIVAVVTNIDNDHLCAYSNSFEELKHSFFTFMHKLPFYGRGILCLDDPTIAELLPKIERPCITYGFNKNADIVISNYVQKEHICKFELNGMDMPPVSIELPLPGKHNASNATAAFICARDAGIDTAVIQQALKSFAGISRRCELRATYNTNTGKILLIDDYGHHPTEIEAVINAIREGWPKRRLIMVYQPHRYSRTKDLFPEFVDVLKKVDNLILLDVYSAGEQEITRASSQDLATAINKVANSSVTVTCVNKELPIIFKAIESELGDNDIVIMQGAGDIHKITPYITKQLKIKYPNHFIVDNNKEVKEAVKA